MLVERSFILAHHGHAGKVDKTGQPYIQHLLRVAGNVPYDYAHIALLHDYFEDVYVARNIEDIRIYANFLDDKGIMSLFLLSRSTMEGTYSEYIDRLVSSGDDAALLIKKADLEDHLRKPVEGLSERYYDALEKINEKLDTVCNGVDGT